MRIWKFAAMACLCCALLGGCGPSSDTKTAAESAAPAAQQEQVEMAVPEKGIPVLMYHMIGDVPWNRTSASRCSF